MAEPSQQIESVQKITPELVTQETDQESSERTSFSYETVVKEELIIEDEFVPPDEGNDDQPLQSPDTRFCEECNKSFTNLATFRSHKYRHKIHKAGKYTCKHCDKRFKDKTSLTIHEQGVHMARKKEPSDESDVKQFPKTITDKTGSFKCSECDERFQFKFQQQQHIRRHTALKQELYKCEECNKPFATPRELRRHIERAHKKHAHKSLDIFVIEEVGCFRCSKCYKTFEEHHLCQQHILRHIALAKEKVLPCQQCDKKFSTQRYLKQHVATYHSST